MESLSNFYKINIDLEQNFNVEQYRLESFGPWFNQEVDKEKLSRAGFFYLNERDYVKCYFCEVSIGSWLRGDNPFIEHKIHSPNCIFLNGQTNNIPIPETEHLLLEELALLRKSNISCPSVSNRNTKLVKLSAECVTQTARHPAYVDKKERLNSFVNWPTSLKQTPEELSDAGFFYLGVGDAVKCFYCGGCLRNFDCNDHALNEHKKYYSNRCLFIQFTYMKLKSNANKLENRRPIKATAEQIDYLSAFMDVNEGMRTGNLSQDRVAYVTAWKELTNTLNDLGGATKDIKGWREVWRNYMYNQKRRGKSIDDMDIISPSSSNTITPQTGISENSIELISKNQTSPSNQTPFKETDMMEFSNVDIQNPNITFQPTMFTAISTTNQDREQSHNSESMSIRKGVIMKLQLQIEQHKLEIEKLQLELDMNIQLEQKQQELQNKWN